MMKNWKWIIGVVVMVMSMAMVSCTDRNNPNNQDPREAFVGEYTFVTTGNIDLYAGAIKVYTVPLDESGTMSITLGNEQNTVWMVASGDSTLAYVSGQQLFIESTREEAVFGDLVMELSFVSGKATLQDKELSWTSDVEITATYQSMSLFGNGQVDIVATKK